MTHLKIPCALLLNDSLICEGVIRKTLRLHHFGFQQNLVSASHLTTSPHEAEEGDTFFTVQEVSTWVISKVLHTVRFLFKNKFILQNTITGLQCNLHYALSQRSNVWASLVFLSGRLRCWCVWLLEVTSLDTSSMFMKRFPRSGFFNFGNKSKAGGLMSGLYGGWGSTCHQYFSQNFRYCTWGMRPRVNVRSLVTARGLTPVSFFFHIKAPFCRTGTT